MAAVYQPGLSSTGSDEAGQPQMSTVGGIFHRGNQNRTKPVTNLNSVMHKLNTLNTKNALFCILWTEHHAGHPSFTEELS